MVISNSDTHDHLNNGEKVPRITDEEDIGRAISPPEGEVRGSNGGISFSL